jgi:hypothetical protein
MKRKWTPLTWKLLYEKLVEKFGPYKTWKTIAVPDPDKKEEFLKVLDDIAKMISLITESETTRDAVFMQLAWATTSQEQVGGAHVYEYIMNIAAAYESGFLASSDFPSYLLCERKINQNNGKIKKS